MPPHSHHSHREFETGETQTNGTLRFVIAFDILHGLALFLLVAIFLTALLSSRIQRLQTWYTFILSFIVLSISNLLLLTRQLGPQPNEQLCMAQSILIHAGPVWTAASGVAFLLQIQVHAYYYLMSCSSKLLGGFVYHLIPVLLYLGIIAEITVLTLQHPGSIIREQNGLYCHSQLDIISKISGGIVGAGIVLMLAFGAITGVMVYRSWAEFKQLRKRSRGGVSITLLIRIGLFSVVSLIVLGISSTKFVTVGPSHDEAAIRLATAAVPLCVALIIGLQGDILRRWMFWKPHEEHTTFSMESSSRGTRSVHARSFVHRTERTSECETDCMPPTPTSPSAIYLNKERVRSSDDKECNYPPSTPNSSTYLRDSMPPLPTGSSRTSLTYMTGSRYGVQ